MKASTLLKASTCICSIATLCVMPTCSSNSAESTAASTDAGNPGAVSSENYFAWSIVERFTRDGVTNHAGSVLVLRKDKSTTEPRMERIDDKCFFHTPLRWDLTGHLPPSFGTVIVKGPGDQQTECEQQPNFVTSGGDTPKGPLWEPGDVIGMTASGKDLPAFDFSAPVPELPTLTSQNLATLQQFEWTIHLNEPLALTWIPVAGEVQAMIIQLSVTGQQQGALRCVFPGQDGAATIPAETLQHLPVGGDATGGANFYFFGGNRQTRTIDGLEMEFENINGLAARVAID